jgi:hypothetical protein
MLALAITIPAFDKLLSGGAGGIGRSKNALLDRAGSRQLAGLTMKRKSQTKMWEKVLTSFGPSGKRAS